ncbi:hypothetical protein OAK67_02745 [Crocinitomicaceae bacterium]|jgi:hypothetical protein|nr:hypothetical protein [Crocinitomicaceae bacterium]
MKITMYVCETNKSIDVHEDFSVRIPDGMDAKTYFESMSQEDKEMLLDRGIEQEIVRSKNDFQTELFYIDENGIEHKVEV